VRVPVRRLELNTIDPGYSTEDGIGYWIDIPRSLSEGFVYDMSQQRRDFERDYPDPDVITDAEAKAAASTEAAKAARVKASRVLNSAFLDLIIDWNIDDDKGKKLPVPRTCKTDEQKLASVQVLPLEIIQHVATEIWSVSKPAAVSAEAEDF
jgi:hypothetical protein